MSIERRRAVAVLSGLSVLTAVAGCSGGSASADPDPVASESAGTDTGTGTDTGADAGTAGYADGTYTATGTYQAPSGEESVEVTLTIAGDAVSEVTVVPQATDPTASQFQDAFASGISEIVGQDVDAVSVDRVSGSSLTSGGFEAALEQIKADAQA